MPELQVQAVDLRLRAPNVAAVAAAVRIDRGITARRCGRGGRSSGDRGAGGEHPRADQQTSAGQFGNVVAHGTHYRCGRAAAQGAVGERSANGTRPVPRERPG